MTHDSATLTNFPVKKWHKTKSSNTQLYDKNNNSSSYRKKVIYEWHYDHNNKSILPVVQSRFSLPLLADVLVYTDDFFISLICLRDVFLPFSGTSKKIGHYKTSKLKKKGCFFVKRLFTVDMDVCVDSVWKYVVATLLIHLKRIYNNNYLFWLSY